MLCLSLVMLFIPPLFALVIHNYLRHGDMSTKRKLIFGLVYLFLINAISLGTSWIRGVHGLRFEDMTMSFRLKYLGLGCVLGFIVPFFVCLLTEEQITLGGFRRYIRRFIHDMYKYSQYAIRSARAELHAEVASSYLNWLWWLIEPMCMMMIYTIIFGVVFNAKEQFFPIFIFIGITMWSFFSRNISVGVGIVRANKGIITKIYMPKFILLFSKMLVNGFKMLVSFGVIVLMMIVFQVPISVHIFEALPILIVLFLFTFGVGTILMHYGVYVNDLGYITGIVLSMMMYFTGTFYSVSKRIPAPFGEVMEMCNPVAFLISSMRKVLLYGEAISWPMLLLWTGITVILIALGSFTIYSNENAYVKVI